VRNAGEIAVYRIMAFSRQKMKTATCLSLTLICFLISRALVIKIAELN